jgi:uncharacterized protein DUF6796
VIGVVASLVASVGDLLLLATSNATRTGFEWLGQPSEAVLLLGTYLGVLAIPCYGLGYARVAARIAPPYRRWITAAGVAGGVLGGTIHGLTGLVVHVEQSGGAAGVDPVALLGRYGAYLLPLWAAAALAILAGSVAYTAALLAGRATLPRAVAFANPIVVTVLLVLVGATSEIGRAFVVPAAPNLAHVVFFAIAALSPAPSRGTA